MIPGAPFPSVGAVNEAVNKFMKCVDEANNPLLVRRGGCASKKKSRSYRSGADGVVAHKAHSGVIDHPVRSIKGGFATFS